MSKLDKPPRSADRFQAFAEELDALRDEMLAKVGEQDARYIRRVVRGARLCAIGGRSLLMFSFIPPFWFLGTGLLALAKIIENMEIGHNVMHGQYDWMNEPLLDSRRYDWDNACAGADWKHAHNVVHHNHTNIIGLDRDYGYGMLRLDERQPWVKRYRRQPAINLITALLFEVGVGVHDAELDAFRDGQIGKEELLRRLQNFRRKFRHQVVKDYVLFPLLGLVTGQALAVLLGNFTANIIRNLWTNIVIFCGHLPDGIHTYTIEETRDETRGEWYARQVEGSANISGGKLMHFLSGHLSLQVEHHLFPDIPAPRYQEMAPRVREICARYGVEYHSGSMPRQYFTVLRRVLRFSRPLASDRSGGAPSPA